MNKIRVILTGGFLGAGKTTSLLQLAKSFQARGMKVGIITNDQGSSLVDGELAKFQGFEGAEITGGCFCCRFHDLKLSMENLINDLEPDVLLAEPVGSCTDLIATVFFPLQDNFPDRFSLAPYTVIADGTILVKLISDDTFPFSPEIRYLYEKQLEEANIIFINKSDLINSEDLQFLIRRLNEKYVGKSIISGCAANGYGFDVWAHDLMLEAHRFYSLDSIDYELYGRAESMLGWYNSSIHLQSDAVFDPNDFMEEVMLKICSTAQQSGGRVAHLKTISKCSGGIIKASLTHTTEKPVFSLKGYDFTKELDIIMNARVEIEASVLKHIVEKAIYIVSHRYGVNVKIEHEECFKPSFPVPSYPREVRANARNYKKNS